MRDKENEASAERLWYKKKHNLKYTYTEKE